MKQTTSVGVRFTETMRGHLALGDRHAHDAADIEGRVRGRHWNSPSPSPSTTSTR